VTRPPSERRFLASIAASPDPRAGLARAAVLLARTECPDADPDRVESMLQSLGADLRRRAPGARTAGERAEGLRDLLSGTRRLRGNREDYGDPRNSCIECVLDRRVGIPIALSIVWMAVGRRAGWDVDGVGLPGHFVVRVRGSDGEDLLADPFHGGGVLSRLDAKRLLEGLLGRRVRLRPEHFEPVSPRELLVRVLRNLRTCYRGRGDRTRGLAVAEDMLLVAPGLPEALRDRGLLRLEAGDRAGAVSDLRSFFEEEPSGADAEATRRLVAALTDGAEILN